MGRHVDDLAARDAAPRTAALALYEAAVASAHPDVCLPAHLPPVPECGRLVIAGAGKAAAAMAAAAERHYRARGGVERITGFTTAPHGAADAPSVHGRSAIRVLTARHPTPDAASQAAAEATLALVRGATADDLV